MTEPHRTIEQEVAATYRGEPIPTYRELITVDMACGVTAPKDAKWHPLLGWYLP